MSYRKTELPVLRSIDENKGQKRLKEVLPRDLVKQSKLTALSSADTNSAVLLENSESASLNKKFAPIESGSVSKEVPYEPYEKERLDFDALLKESSKLISDIDLSPEDVSVDTLNQDNSYPLEMEPLSDSDFAL